MLYSKDIQENKKYRLKVLSKALNDKELQKLLRAKCEKDVLFFFNTFLWTYDPRVNPSNLPFITYDFQDEFILWIVKDIEEQNDIFVEKSRDMWFTWMMLWVFLRWFLFKKRSILCGSYKQDYVDIQWNMDSLFERLRYMSEKLPRRMTPEDYMEKYMLITWWGWEIAWDVWENFGTGWRRTVIFMDEFSYRKFPKTALRKTRDVTRCRILWGTPNGRFNPYWQIGTKSGEYSKLEFSRYRLLWRQHPKKTQERYEEQKKTRTEYEMATELDISYDNSIEWAVYKDFSKIVNIWSFPYMYHKDRRTYLSFDFWRDMNAMIVWQKDFRTNQLFIPFCVARKNWHIKKFMCFVTGKPTMWFKYTTEDFDDMKPIKQWRESYTAMFWDPYNWKSKQTNTSNSIVDVFEQFWYYLECETDTTVEERIRKVILELNRVNIDEWCLDLITAMEQSRYPNVREWSENTTEKTKPVHDDTSHFRTAFEYFVDREPETLATLTQKPVVQRF